MCLRLLQKKDAGKETSRLKSLLKKTLIAINRNDA